MSSIGTGYDLSSTTYSPDGKVFQIEYAQKAVDNSGSVVGLKCKDGVVLGVEKLVLSKMMVEGSNRRIHTVDRHAGMAICGLLPDGRQLIGWAGSESANWISTYGDRIPAQVLADRVASAVHTYTLYWSVRPFGAAVLLAVADQDGPQLYSIEPSGEFHRFFGTALGKGRQQAKTEIERLKLTELTCRQAVLEVAKIIYRVHDEKDKAFELELSWVCEETSWEHKRVPADLHAEAVAAGKAALEEGMED